MQNVLLEQASKKEESSMRAFLLAMALLVFASYAVADEVSVRTAEPVTYTPPDREIIYVQPPSSWWWTINASSPFNSWLKDDIPDELYCNYFNDIDFYVCEWGGYWMQPVGVTIHIYYSECPPDQSQYIEYYFPWDQIVSELAYEDPGWLTVYYCVVYLPEDYHIEYDMSLGFQVDLDWGQNPPYAGVVMTDDYVWFGDCEAWWDGSNWGYEGYVSGYFGTQADVAYSLSYEVSGTGSTTWGEIKSLFW
jgi:hypothetical protein